MDNTANTTETKEITVQELIAAFKGKHVNISPTDHYGISINMNRATLEQEDNDGELYFALRDDSNKVLGSICIDEDSIESIEQYGDTYTVNFAEYMTSVDIAEYKKLNELQQECGEK